MRIRDGRELGHCTQGNPGDGYTLRLSAFRFRPQVRFLEQRDRLQVCFLFMSERLGSLSLPSPAYP